MSDIIDRVEVFCLNIPYTSEVRYASTSDTMGAFVILRLTTKDGAVGIAECCSRAEQSNGDNIHTVAYQIETHFKHLIMGIDPLSHDAILHKIAKMRSGI